MTRRQILVWMAALALAAGPRAACAQGVQIFELLYGAHPASMLSGFDGRELLQGQEVGLGSFKATLSLPVVLAKDRSYLYNKLSYRRLDMSFKDLPSGVAPQRVETVQSLKYELTWAQRLKPKWWLSSIGSIELASDFEDIARQDLQVQGALLLTRSFSDRFTLGGGAALTNSSGDPRIVPVVYVKHTGARHRFELVFPERAAGYLLSGKTLQIGLAAEYDGNRYHVDRGLEVRFSTIQAGPSARWRFTPALALALDAGVAAERKFVGFFEPAEEDDAGKLDTGIFVRTGLQLWVSTGEDAAR